MWASLSIKTKKLNEDDRVTIDRHRIDFRNLVKNYEYHVPTNSGKRDHE